MLDLVNRGVACDLVTVSENLKSTGKRTGGGIGYLSDLASAVPSTTNVEYARIVSENPVAPTNTRGQPVIEHGYAAEDDATAILDQAKQLF